MIVIFDYTDFFVISPILLVITLKGQICDFCCEPEFAELKNLKNYKSKLSCHSDVRRNPIKLTSLQRV